ncbi:MAG: sodium transporter [Candidatus Omnitrophota bacterium]|jgi:SSS family solute:Na+ symporter|nr:MAG: sodium transporter [Candidatus Omnitrophota bacterium]
MEFQALQGIDYGIMILYLLGTVALGIYLGRNIKSGEDYFLAGRKLPWWAIGMSLVVSDIGAIDIVGIAGSAYLYGIVLGNFDWLGSVPIMIIAGFVFVPYFYRARVYTIPEFLGKRFNIGVRTVTTLVWGIFLACNLGIMLYATAKMMNVMLEWPVMYSIFISAFLVGLYTLVGGLAAVVYTDVIQCAVMMGGCALTLCIGLYNAGGVSEFMNHVYSLGDQYKNHFDLVLPADTETPFPWSGILLGLGLVLAPAYWIGNQAIIQRCLGARSEFEVKASLVFGSILKTFIPIIMVIPGILVLTHNANITDPDSALPILIRDILPTGVLGIFFAAFLAAFMSSVDSCLNSSATLWTCDIYQRFFRPNETQRHYLIVGRIFTFLFIVGAAFFAMWVQGREESIYTIIQTMLSVFQGPSLALLLLGGLWWRTTGIGAFIGLVCGIACSITLMFIDATTNPQLRVDDLKNPAAIVMKLKDPQDAISQYLYNELSEDTRKQLSEFDGSTSPDSLVNSLVGNLNELSAKQVLFDETLTAQMNLTDNTRQLFEQQPQGKNLIRLNRLLLDQAYPEDIETNPHAANPPLFLIQDPFLYIAFWSFMLSMFLTITISLLTKPEPEEKLVGLVYRYKGRSQNG